MWEFLVWIVIFPFVMFVVSYAAAEGMERWIARTEVRAQPVAVCADPGCHVCARNKEAQGAEKKAKKLFHSLLTPEQLKEAKARGTVTEVSRKTGRTYVISLHTLVSNISIQKDGYQEARLCIYMLSPNDGSVPPSDHFIAQLMYIRYNETGLLRKAIMSRY